MGLPLFLLASGLSVGAIVARVKAVDARIHNLEARVRMEILSEGKKKTRVFDLALLRDGVNYRSRLTLIEPAEMSGTRFLVVAERGKRNREWAYFPDLEEVRPIAARSQNDSFLGSDVTYADLAGGAHLDDLVHRLEGEEVVDGTPCYVLEGRPRHEIEYGKLTAWVRKDSFAIVRARFFDRALKPLKEARLRDIQALDGALVAHRIEVKSAARSSETLLTLDAVRVNQGLPAERFTEAGFAKN